MTWFDASVCIPINPGPYLVYCGLDTCQLPIYFLATYSQGHWWVDESENLVGLPIRHWAEITPPEAPQ